MIRAVAFDVNGTLVRIHTDESAPEIFRAAAHLLTYQGIHLHRFDVREEYFRRLKQQQRASPEEFPEFDAVDIWRAIVEEHRTAYTDSLPEAKLAQLPLFLAELARGISRRRLTLYPQVREVLDVLRTRYPLAVVSDGQTAHARAELHRVGVLDHFDVVVVSGDHGYRKPDPRLFRLALDAMGVAAEDTLCVGNDLYRDVFGAQAAGMRTALVTYDHTGNGSADCLPDHYLAGFRDLLSILDPTPQ